MAWAWLCVSAAQKHERCPQLWWRDSDRLDWAQCMEHHPWLHARLASLNLPTSPLQERGFAGEHSRSILALLRLSPGIQAASGFYLFLSFLSSSLSLQKSILMYVYSFRLDSPDRTSRPCARPLQGAGNSVTTKEQHTETYRYSKIFTNIFRLLMCSAGSARRSKFAWSTAVA